MTVVPDLLLRGASGGATGTEYVILQQEIPESQAARWLEIDIVRATSASQAVMKAIEGGQAPGGTYMAVPARSWHPVRVQVEQVSRVRLESA